VIPNLCKLRATAAARPATAILTTGVAAIAAIAATAVLAADALRVDYPAGYRSWHHVKSMVIEPGHPLYGAFGGIHHLYANPAAVQGYRTGRFPDGAVIVFDLLEAKRDGNAVVEGARKILGVMQRDSRRFTATGGWGFEGFGGGNPTDRKVGADAKGACFACHESQAGPDFVFSADRP